MITELKGMDQEPDMFYGTREEQGLLLQQVGLKKSLKNECSARCLQNGNFRGTAAEGFLSVAPCTSAHRTYSINLVVCRVARTL